MTEIYYLHAMVINIPTVEWIKILKNSSEEERCIENTKYTNYTTSSFIMSKNNFFSNLYITYIQAYI